MVPGCCSAKVFEREADHPLMAKNNQPTLAAAAEGCFEAAQRAGEGTVPSRAEWVEKDHGRIETRRCVVINDLSGMANRPDWAGVKTLVLLESIRETNGVASCERRYHISSLAADAERLGRAARGHWGVENGLHWSLDVAYGEDQARMRDGNAAENFPILRRITLNLIRQDTSVKAGVKNRHKVAGWDDGYRENCWDCNPWLDAIALVEGERIGFVIGTFLTCILFISWLTTCLYRRGRRHAMVSGDRLLKKDNRDAVLYLRAFLDDGAIKMWARANDGRIFLERFVRISFEDLVTDHLWRYGPVVAIGDPRAKSKLAPLGAARDFVPNDTNETWKKKAKYLMQQASIIVAVIGENEGFLSEINEIVELGCKSKLVLLLPPIKAQDLRAR